MKLEADLALNCYHLGVLQRFIGSENLLPYLGELFESREMLDRMEANVKEVDFFRTKHWDSVIELGLYRIAAYVLTRALKPNIFIETGILHGLTSNFILAAIARNTNGKLISIDYPSYFETGPSNRDGAMDTLPPGKEPGWAVEQRLRPWWQVVIGKSLEELPPVFERHSEVDIFLHDSEHTYDTMWGEFVLAWDHIRSGGLLIADNINNTQAFVDFTKHVDQKPLLLPSATGATSLDDEIRFGIIRK